MERNVEARAQKTLQCLTVVCMLPFRVPYHKAFFVIFATMVPAFSISPITLCHYYL